MFTLVLGCAQGIDWQQVMGIILTVIEVLMIVIRVLQCFVNPKSKFGIFLAKFQLGATKVKDEVEKHVAKEDDEKKTE